MSTVPPYDPEHEPPELALADESVDEQRERRGSSCLGVLGTLFVVGAVIVGTVIASPILDLTDLRDVVRTDPLDGVEGSGGDGYTYLITTDSGAPITTSVSATRETVPLATSAVGWKSTHARKMT